jgi:RNA-binding protein 5/10
MQPIKIGFGNAIKKKPKEEPAMVEIMSKGFVDDNDEVDLVGKDSVLLSRTKGAHIVPPTSTSRKVAGFINKWNTKQNELSAPRQPKAPNAPPAGVSAANAAPVAQAPAPSQPQAQASTSNEFDYGDTHNFATTGKVACLLCQRQFKSEEMLRKHSAQSELHKARTTLPEPRRFRPNGSLTLSIEYIIDLLELHHNHPNLHHPACVTNTSGSNQTCIVPFSVLATGPDRTPL